MKRTDGVVDGLGSRVGDARNGILSRLEVGLALVLGVVGTGASAVRELLRGGLGVAGLDRANELVGTGGDGLGGLVEGGLLGVGSNLLLELISNGLAAGRRMK